MSVFDEYEAFKYQQESSMDGDAIPVIPIV